MRVVLSLTHFFQFLHFLSGCGPEKPGGLVESVHVCVSVYLCISERLPKTGAWIIITILTCQQPVDKRMTVWMKKDCVYSEITFKRVISSHVYRDITCTLSHCI